MTTTSSPSASPTYLVELMDMKSEQLEHVDLFLNLAAAVQCVHRHLSAHCDEAVNVEVSFDSDFELEGIVFFNPNRNILSCITVYRMERDTETAEDPQILTACSAELEDLEFELNKVFKK